MNCSLRIQRLHCPATDGERCNTLINFVKDRPGHDLRYAMNIGKIAGELGFEPTETLSSGINKTVRWFLGNDDWWRSLLDNSYEQWLQIQYG